MSDQTRIVCLDHLLLAKTSGSESSYWPLNSQKTQIKWRKSKPIRLLTSTCWMYRGPISRTKSPRNESALLPWTSSEASLLRYMDKAIFLNLFIYLFFIFWWTEWVSEGAEIPKFLAPVSCPPFLMGCFFFFFSSSIIFTACTCFGYLIFSLYVFFFKITKKEK